MDRSNPYEAAFEKYLADRGLCYVGVDEKKRSLLGDVPVKNLDFIVLGGNGSRLLVDIKGRQFPSGPPSNERFIWHNWATQDDIEGITQWMKLFGNGYLGLFVFIYRIGPNVVLADDTPDLWTWQDHRYLLRAVTVDDYRAHMRVRSPRWRTVCLSNPVFRALARPFRYYSDEFVMAGASPHEQDQDRSLREITRFAFTPSPARDTQTRPPGP